MVSQPQNIAAGQLQLIEPEMARVPGGYFLMGSEGFYRHESPMHRVWVDEFEMGKYTVTNREYECFLKATGHEPPPFFNDERFNRPNQPVVGVSWYDAIAYCRWLSRETGRNYHLPTEAEWERAARGGLEGKLYAWGDEPPQERRDYNRRWLADRPEEVGLYEPNLYGLYNIGDNVHEWCSDWFGADYYQVSPERNPQGPVTGLRRASRGGSWRHQVKVSRCAARSSLDPGFRYSDYGFRCMRALPGRE